ncbi:K+-transporting ATPase ATPase C chain [Marininema mesophilum]|uniref:Potassium-transporting ATPase KdpC subunit n=1 Tax=Marininema mesophilum TaxID=1048340 RepID=A0A1H2TS93_9BACL|nr:potassium-transporting ATPase subunit KdpC [Marininema mesophilum]SDW46139.1 K+-transporting ATPase ATPase C chain [Marininema mesophilum]
MKAIRISLLMVVICGLVYPLLMTGLSQLLFPYQAQGSIMKDSKGKALGSEIIGQKFTSDRYFHGRVSSIDYDASGSGSENYAPSNKQMIERTEKEATKRLKENPGATKGDVPLDLITNSGSGLDPQISPEAARFQIPRVARATKVSEEKLSSLVSFYTEKKELGVFGEPRVNVLKLNQALDAIVQKNKG